MHEAGLGKIWLQHSTDSAGPAALSLEKMVFAILDNISQ
jgi:hypothetical protein